MALISFQQYSSPKNKLERKIRAELNCDLEGDWLNPPPDLNAGEYRCRYAIEVAKGQNDALKYSNPMKVVREDKAVYIVRTGISTGKEERVCGYELINNSENRNNMAKTKNVKIETVATLTHAGHQVEDVPVSKIYPCDTNPRKSMDEDALIDLAKSMHDVGLLQAITIRPDEKGKYEIVAGHRRFKAAQSLKWETIPAMIREIGDEEILEIQIIENLQREDVSPMDEAAAFQSILQRESYDWLCSRIHKSKKYITDRLKLNDLIEEGREHVHSSVLPLTHAIMISKLPEVEQKKCIDKCVENDWIIDKEVCKLTINQLREFIEDDLMVDLERACFDLEDDELLPDATSCAACPKRTCNQNLLFQEITEDDKCTDAACFHEKEKAHVETTLKKAKEEYGKAAVYTGEKHPYSKNLVKVKGIYASYREKPTKGKDELCVVITKTDSSRNNNALGKKLWIDRSELDGKVKEKAEVKASGGSMRSGGGYDWKTQDKKEFKETVFPRLLQITQFLSTESINNAQIIALNYIKAKFGLESYRNILSLAVVMGVHSTEPDPDTLYETESDNEWDDKVKMIDLIIDNVKGKGFETLLVVLAMLDKIENDDGVRTEKQRALDEDLDYNWAELIELIEGKKKTPKSKPIKSKK